jgi:hypothetical protein
MRNAVVVLAALAIVACGRDRQYEAGGETDTIADTTRGLDIDVGTKTDTINVPTFGTETDTMVVKKPVYTGKKGVEVQRPTVDVKRP